MASITDPSQSRRRSPAASAPVVPGVPDSARLSHPVMLAAFLLTATQPYSIELGPLLIGPYRLVLMILAVPILVGWISGKYGRFVLPDFLMLGHVLWMAVCLAANGQGSRVSEYVGGEFIDSFVAYLLGRAAIRSKADLYYFARSFLLILLVLLPFAVLESTRGMMIMQDLYRNLPGIKLFNPVTLTYPSRMGMLRAQTTINHPIVFGVFCSMAFSLGWVALKYAGGGMSRLRRLVMVAGSAGGTFFSLSAGAFSCLLIQLGMIGWNTVLARNPNRWKIMGGGLAIVYVVLDIVASKPPLVVMARFVAFSASTSWNRYQIWQFGSAEVGRHMLFGKGLMTDWVRLPWMPLSVDNHWLLVAMRFGLPGIGMLLGAYFYIYVRLVRMNFSPDPAMSAIRYAFIFTFSGLFISLATVTIWHVTYSIILMMMGGAVWVFNEPPAGSFVPKGGRAAPVAGRGRAAVPAAAAGAPATPKADSPARAARRRFTRFPDGPPGRTG